MPRLPSNIARGTLSGLFGRAVTYSAAFGPISCSTLMEDRDGCRVAFPVTYTLSSEGASADAGRIDGGMAMSNVDAAASTARREGIDTDDDDDASSMMFDVEQEDVVSSSWTDEFNSNCC